MAKQNDTLVGVFLDEEHAQRALQELKSAGVNARIADKSAIQAFRNVGWDDEIIRMYESRLAEGNSIVAVDAGQKGDEALGIMMDCGAEYMNLKTSGQEGGQAANDYAKLESQKRQYGRYDETRGRAQTADEMRVQLREETLTPVKQAVQAGEVELHKVVHEKQEQVPVTLRHEEVYVERTAVDRPLQAGEIGDMQDEVIRVPVYEEQAELQKQMRVREEVGIGKEAIQEQQTLTGTTKHEHLEIQQSGDVKVQGNVDTTDTTRATDQSETNR